MKSFYEEKLNPDDFYNAYYHRESVDWDKLYKNYNAGVDWPTVTFYKELLNRYPDAKVILTIRSADSWYNSVKNTLHRHSLRSDKIDPNHPTYRVARMINTFLFEGLIGDTDRFEQNEMQIKQMFIDHNEEVMKFVPKDQLLVLELGEGWEKLCAFLGKEVPDVPYPILNSTQDFQQNISKHRKNLAKNEEPICSTPKTEIQSKNRHHGKIYALFFGKQNKKVPVSVKDSTRGDIGSDKRLQRILKDIKARLFVKTS
ncbi:unnamed protein product [Mucor hiemalis]